MDEALTPQEERDALAAELALGVLDGQERAVALRAQLSDHAFAKLVADWEARLEPLHGEWEGIAPRDAVWNAVAARIESHATLLHVKVRRWRAGALSSGALAAALAVILVMRSGEAPDVIPAVAVPVAIAQIGNDTGGPLVLARYDPQSVQVRLRITGVAPGKLSPELWVIPTGGAPTSLGIIPRDGQTTVTLSAQQRRLLVEGATLAISMERADSAPHIAPSSAPIAAGKISVL